VDRNLAIGGLEPGVAVANHDRVVDDGMGGLSRCGGKIRGRGRIGHEP
jgi:hypothetical protein